MLPLTLADCRRPWRAGCSDGSEDLHGLSEVLRGHIAQVARDCCGNAQRVGESGLGDGRLGLVTREALKTAKSVARREPNKCIMSFRCPGHLRRLCFLGEMAGAKWKETFHDCQGCMEMACGVRGLGGKAVTRPPQRA
jgi:hypothetical protein